MKVSIMQTRRTDIVGYLRAIGVTPTKEDGVSAWYHAPYREDRTPSFKVNKLKNRWYDFGTGGSGDIIDLGCLLYRSGDIFEVMRRITDISPAVQAAGRDEAEKPQEAKESAIQIRQVLELASPALLQYLGSRGIGEAVAREFCSEVRFGTEGKRYYGIGFRNVRGGYEVRNGFFKGCVGPKDVSVVRLGEHHKECMLFEGFMDFLSYVTLNRRCGFMPLIEKVMDCVVLNSVTNLRRALPLLEAYQTVACCLDNDDAGRRTVDLLAESRDGVQDVSGAYSGYKDLNDFLCGKKYCP